MWQLYKTFQHYLYIIYTESMLIHEICKQSKTDGPFSFITRKMMQIMYSQGIKAYMELNILLLFCFYPINIEIYIISVVVSIPTNLWSHTSSISNYSSNNFFSLLEYGLKVVYDSNIVRLYHARKHTCRQVCVIHPQCYMILHFDKTCFFANICVWCKKTKGRAFKNPLYLKFRDYNSADFLRLP